MAVGKIQKLKLKNIIIDHSIQPREDGTDEAHVQELTETYRGSRDKWPKPPRVWNIGGKGKLKLSSGFHRVPAAMAAGIEELECVVFSGTEEECEFDALISNAENRALSYTAKDKRRVIKRALEMKPKESLRELQRQLNFSYTLIVAVRDEFFPERKRLNPDPPIVATQSTDDITAPLVADDDEDTVEFEIKPDDTPQESVPDAEPVVVEPEPVVSDPPQQTAPVHPPKPAPRPSTPEPVELPGSSFCAAVRRILHAMDGLTAQVKTLETDTYAYAVDIQRAAKTLEGVRNDLFHAIPDQVCPQCKCSKPKQTTCKYCQSTGVVTKTKAKWAGPS